MPALDCESAWVTTILWPRMPPAALISSTARSMPFFQLVPTVAPPPDSSATSAIWMSWARLDVATARARSPSPAAAIVLMFVPPVYVGAYAGSGRVGAAFSICHHFVEGGRHRLDRRPDADEELESVGRLKHGEVATRHGPRSGRLRRDKQRSPQ